MTTSVGSAIKILPNPDVIFFINEINSFFFRVKVYKQEDGEIPSFNGDPSQAIRSIVSAEDTLQQMDPITRGIMGTSEHCYSASSPPKGREILPITDVDHIISTLNNIQTCLENGERDKIKIVDIQRSQDILSNYLLIKTGNQKITTFTG